MALVDALLFISIASSGITLSVADTFDVTQYGAVGDGKRDDSQAFLKAWTAACGAGGSSVINVPSGKEFFLNPLKFSGPCKSSTIQIQINGNLVAPCSKDAWKGCTYNTWIVFENVEGLDIKGTATLDAKGSSWWATSGVYDMDNDFSNNSSPGECQKPATFRVRSCNNFQMKGLSFLNSGANHISMDYSKYLTIDGINIKAPKDSPNTDGINVVGSSNVRIQNSNIGTGDDCISISDKCLNINITGINCGPGHGISIGSLGRSGIPSEVESIYVKQCTFTKTLASTRIKTWPGGAGYARNIHYDRITLDGVHSTLEINQHYFGSIEKKKAVKISGISFTNVHGTGEQILVDCSKNAPCQQIILEQVNITSAVPGKKVEVTCNHADVRTNTVSPQISCTE